MTDDREPPAERIDTLSGEFEEVVDTLRAGGERPNVIVSDPMREATEMYLKQAAEEVLRSDTGPILGEVVVSKAATILPHATKGQIRGALAYYLASRDESGEQWDLINDIDNNER